MDNVPFINTKGFVLITVASFVMLLSMTIGQQPIQKAIDNLTDKHKKEATKQVCNTLYQKREVYSTYMRNTFISGCMWEIRQINLKINDAKYHEKIEKIFEDKNSMEYDKFYDQCSSGASSSEYSNQIQEMVVADLYYELKCQDLHREQ